MSDTFVPPETRHGWDGPRHCPRCVWPYLSPVHTQDGKRLLCASCGHCWRSEHGRLRPVDAVTCAGCRERSKHDCIELLQHEFPRFAAGVPSDSGPANEADGPM